MIEIKLIRIVTGEEIVAEVLDTSEDSLKIQNALVVIPQQQGVGFAPWATVISKDTPEIVIKQEHVVYTVEVQEEVAGKYNEMFGSKLVTPAAKKLVL
jgi:membrane-anchored protein YejM (alkaline phosphatase superfamily)